MIAQAILAWIERNNALVSHHPDFWWVYIGIGLSASARTLEEAISKVERQILEQQRPLIDSTVTGQVEQAQQLMLMEGRVS